MKAAEKRMRAAIKLFLAGALGSADRVPSTAKGTQRRRPSR
jgi:hypothetical protein